MSVVVPRRWRPLGRSMAHNRWPCRPRVGPLVCLTRAVRNRRNLETCFHYINPSFSSRKIRRTPFILTDKLPPLILLSRWCISIRIFKLPWKDCRQYAGQKVWCWVRKCLRPEGCIWARRFRQRNRSLLSSTEKDVHDFYLTNGEAPARTKSSPLSDLKSRCPMKINVLYSIHF